MKPRVQNHDSSFRATLLIFKPLFSILVLVAVTLFPCWTFAQSELDEAVLRLRRRLVDSSIDSNLVTRYFDDNRFRIIDRLLHVNIRQPDASAGYSRFVGDESVKEAFAFLEKNRRSLTSVLDGGPVDPEVVTAILQVESNLGKDAGDYSLLNVFASLSLLDNDNLESLSPAFWRRILDDVTPGEREKLRRKAHQKAKKKARWAFRELLTLFQLAEKGRLDPLTTRSSWAGAFGMAQFLPSSYEAYARDGDNDGIVDLYNLKDAVASISYYLQRHGYRKDNLKKRRKAVWSYNHSEDYVTCILTLADKIDQQRRNKNP